MGPVSNREIYTSADIAFEAARRGQKVGADAIRKAARAHRITPVAVTVGGVRLYDAAAVEEWLTNRRRRGGSGGGGGGADGSSTGASSSRA